MNEKKNVSLTLPLGTILFVVFLVLKLCGVIKWSWWWVFAPLWINAIIAIALIIVGCIISHFEEKNEDVKDKERKQRQLEREQHWKSLMKR